jgi:transcriptional regulator with PAS, ATPase and Fis domain
LTDPNSLDRWDGLHSVQVAREILRDMFGLELLIVGSDGPIAHVKGGVMASSSAVCRVSLFSREGFARCDAEYRDVGDTRAPQSRGCHLGLTIVSEPVSLDERVLAHCVASGFIATELEGVPAADPARIAQKLPELDPNLVDPAEPVRKLPVVRGSRIKYVRSVLRAAAREIAAHEEDRRRRASTEDDLPGMWGIIGTSPQMREVFEQLRRVANSEATVLVLGESGTGKELVARALHDHGTRHGKAFVAQSCAAMTDALLESTLFGHVRGAFSGAVRSTTGLFGAAEGGTLFLDDVGEMSAALQVKLLRVLQDRTYLPVGATSPRKADVRVIAASGRDVSEMVASGEFRQDLFYRLHVLPIKMPPLRERPEDVRWLVERFLRETAAAPRTVSDASWACLERYRWPGNIRELRAEVLRWDIAAAEAREVGPEHLSAAIRMAGGYSGDEGGEAAAAAAAGTGTLAAAVEALEKAIIQRGLERTAGNRSRLAKELGISRTTLGERLKKYDLE